MAFVGNSSHAVSILHVQFCSFCTFVFQVMKILTSSKELTDLVKKMDAVFHSKQAGSGKLMLNSLYRYVPLIREHLQVDLCLFCASACGPFFPLLLLFYASFPFV